MMKFLRTQMKWIMAIIVIAFLLSTFLMYEGRGTRRTPTRNADGTMTDYEVAQINGRSLMRSELEQRLRNYLATYSNRSMTSIDIPALYRSVLNQAILESQMTKEVEEKGIRVSDAEADQAMKNYADTYFPTREAFYQVLANSGLKPEDYKKSLARQIASDRLIRDAIGEVAISEDKVVEFYDTMKDILYSRPEGFMIHMADFNTPEDAEKFRARIAGGESWDVVASGDSAGAINITNSPVMLPESALKTGTLSVLDSIDVGTVSPVFEVASGDYAVALKASHVESGTTPYDEVSADIRVLLTQQEERNRLAAYEESLMNKAVVVINDNELFASPA
ncbi:MAG: SurA N-terminal domain-containing protein, partial [Synergistaceae bacterium]|nr:SurA N-terminal domain-containing protein [Synergistaceae bacterium]